MAPERMRRSRCGSPCRSDRADYVRNSGATTCHPPAVLMEHGWKGHRELELLLLTRLIARTRPSSMCSTKNVINRTEPEIELDLQGLGAAVIGAIGACFQAFTIHDRDELRLVEISPRSASACSAIVTPGRCVPSISPKN